MPYAQETEDLQQKFVAELEEVAARADARPLADVAVALPIATRAFGFRSPSFHDQKVSNPSDKGNGQCSKSKSTKWDVPSYWGQSGQLHTRDRLFITPSEARRASLTLKMLKSAARADAFVPFSMAKHDSSLTETLLAAVSQSQGLIKQLEDQAATIDRLFHQDTVKQVEIERLKKELRLVRAKERKLRLHNPQLASPIVSPDEVSRISLPNAPPPSAPSTGQKATRCREEAHSQPSPARKRLRTASRDTSALREIRNDARNLHSGPDGLEKAVAAIPMLAEDGEDLVEAGYHHIKSLKVDSSVKQGSYSRLSMLLGVPQSPVHASGKPDCTKSASPETVGPKVPKLRQSSSERLKGQEPARRPKPRFKLPQPQRRENQQPLRTRPVSSLALSDFKLNPSYIEESENRASDSSQRQDGLAAVTAALGHDAISEDDLLLDFLGSDSEMRIANLTKVARENLLHEAKAKRLADQFKRQLVREKAYREGHIDASAWSVEFAPSQEDKRSRQETNARVRAEIDRRHTDAMKGGRWKFKDE